MRPIQVHGREWSEEPGSARSNAPRTDEYQETYHWGVPLGPLQIVMSLLYGLLTAVLLWSQARKLVVYVEASHATLCRPCLHDLATEQPPSAFVLVFSIAV